MYNETKLFMSNKQIQKHQQQLEAVLMQQPDGLILISNSKANTSPRSSAGTSAHTQPTLEIKLCNKVMENMLGLDTRQVLFQKSQFESGILKTDF